MAALLLGSRRQPQIVTELENRTDRAARGAEDARSALAQSWGIQRMVLEVRLSGAGPDEELLRRGGIARRPVTNGDGFFGAGP